MDYEKFLDKKSQLGGDHGFEPIWIPDFLFGFQKIFILPMKAEMQEQTVL